jgi:transcriptional regulator with XRE-family HTH domain
MDQKDLAEIVQVTEKTVSNWEIGEHSPHRKVGHLAEALGVSEAYLWQGEGDAPDSDSIVKVLEDQLRVHRSILDELRLIRLEREDRRQDRVPM